MKFSKKSLLIENSLGLTKYNHNSNAQAKNISGSKSFIFLTSYLCSLTILWNFLLLLFIYFTNPRIVANPFKLEYTLEVKSGFYHRF